MLGCWSYARRKFVDVTKVSSNGRSAHDMLELVRRLYEVEHAAEQNKLDPSILPNSGSKGLSPF